MTTDGFLSLLQFSDGLFPTGAYAHSFGLETYVQDGTVHDAAGVEEFLSVLLEGSVAPVDAVAVCCAWRAAQADDLTSCLDLDRLLDAMKAAAEIRDASRQMGRQTLRVAAHIYRHAFLERFGAAVESSRSPGHHAVAFGVVGSVNGWPLENACGAYLYAASTTVTSAALRLMPLGQLAGQRILANVAPLVARLAAETPERARDDMWSFTPGVEIAAMRHADLDARLFRS